MKKGHIAKLTDDDIINTIVYIRDEHDRLTKDFCRHPNQYAIADDMLLNYEDVPVIWCIRIIRYRIYHQINDAKDGLLIKSKEIVKIVPDLERLFDIASNTLLLYNEQYGESVFDTISECLGFNYKIVGFDRDFLTKP